MIDTTALPLDFPRWLTDRHDALPPEGNYRMFAIAFDLDTETLEKVYPNDSWRNAYGDIKRILIDEGFEWRQGSVYFGRSEKINMVKCIIAARRLARELPWFRSSVRDLRMLRIEDTNDLLPILDDPAL
jgi:virulence-associated protein VapD